MLKAAPWSSQTVFDERELQLDWKNDDFIQPVFVSKKLTHPLIQSTQQPLKLASFPVKSNGKLELVYQLPYSNQRVDHEHRHVIHLEELEGIREVSILNHPGRLSDALNNIDSHIEQIISLFYHIFQESNASNISGSFLPMTWRVFIAAIGSYDRDSAPVTLLVRLIKRQKLINAILSVMKNPRVLLQRTRKVMKLSKVRELDARCIRKLASSTGRTLVERAGPKQEILAVSRKEETRTLENYVAIWTVETMIQRALNYRRDYSQFRERDEISACRILEVEQSKHRIQTEYEKSNLFGLSHLSLRHPVIPNYTLQQNERYSCIYQAYRELQDEERVNDLAWMWFPSMWSNFCKLSFISMAISRMYLKPQLRADLQLRKHFSPDGWVLKGCLPHLWKSRNDHKLFLFDLEDVDGEDWIAEEHFPGSESIGQLGCQTIFWDPGNAKIVVVNYLATMKELVQSQLTELESRISTFLNKNPEIKDFTYVCFNPSNSDAFVINAEHQNYEIHSVPFSTQTRPEELESLLNRCF